MVFNLVPSASRGILPTPTSWSSPLPVASSSPKRHSLQAVRFSCTAPELAPPVRQP